MVVFEVGVVEHVDLLTRLVVIHHEHLLSKVVLVLLTFLVLVLVVRLAANQAAILLEVAVSIELAQLLLARQI